MIGVGKTTYVNYLAERLASEAFYESVDDNPILDKFYADPKKYAFMSQVYFLSTRYAASQKASQYNKYLLDRHIIEDVLFAEVNHALGRLTDEEKVVYDTLADKLVDEVKAMGEKNLYIYLQASFDTIMERIAMRDRSFEQDDSLIEYYRALHTRYDTWITQHIAPSELMVIDANQYDINRKEDREAILDQISMKILTMGM